MSAGRPSKYNIEYNEQVYKLALLGATDAQIASFFNVCVSTINVWKKGESEFLVSLKRGKEEADSNVAESLYKRACGYSLVTQKAFKVRTGNGSKESIEVVSVEENYPPDTTACIIWLKNRKPAQWRENKADEEEGLRERELELYDAPRNGKREKLMRFLQ